MPPAHDERGNHAHQKLQRARPCGLLVRVVAPLLLLTAVTAACAGTPPTGGGPIQVSQIDVPASAGFGGGTIHYPRTGGPYGVVAEPGFTENAAAIQHRGPYLASQGFVTITINTTSGLITPEQRSTEQLQALQYVIDQSRASGTPSPGGSTQPQGGRRALDGRRRVADLGAERPLDRRVLPLAPGTSTSSPASRPHAAAGVPVRSPSPRWRRTPRRSTTPSRRPPRRCTCRWPAAITSA